MTQAGLDYDQCTPAELSAQFNGSALYELLAQVEESKWNQKGAADIRQNAGARSFFKVRHASHCGLQHIDTCRARAVGAGLQRTPLNMRLERSSKSWNLSSSPCVTLRIACQHVLPTWPDPAQVEFSITIVTCEPL